MVIEVSLTDIWSGGVGDNFNLSTWEVVAGGALPLWMWPAWSTLSVPGKPRLQMWDPVSENKLFSMGFIITFTSSTAEWFQVQR